MQPVNDKQSRWPPGMSSGYSANQYENAFNSQKLQNWTVPKHFKERPSAAEGHTIFIASDRGHLLPGVKAKRGSAWPDFKGTWELPARLPPASINPTARSEEGRQRLTHTYKHSHTHSGLDIHTHMADKTTTTPAADSQMEEVQTCNAPTSETSHRRKTSHWAIRSWGETFDSSLREREQCPL
ncbi:protein Flattop-like, partial [Oncorhynchus keta]|uniref:protein Flattop-like n=1 Tax=Oncorhynchus keta TaxID=8018 RepID=UPI00227ADC0A